MHGINFLSDACGVVFNSELQTLPFIIIKRIVGVHCQFYSLKARLLQLHAPDVIEYWVFDNLTGARSEVRIDLEQSLEDVDQSLINVLEKNFQIYYLRLVLVEVAQVRSGVGRCYKAKVFIGGLPCFL